MVLMKDFLRIFYVIWCKDTVLLWVFLMDIKDGVLGV